MRIEVYLDDSDTPLQTLTPPEKFRLDTESIDDGPHELTFKAIDTDDTASYRKVAFTVQNGPAIAVHGVVDGDLLTGNVSILANAYSSRIGDEFEPVRMETPTPVPTWAWLLVLIVFAWGAGYFALELSDRMNAVASQQDSTNALSSTVDSTEADWTALGEQVYGNNCSSCHQANGTGLAGVFPSLVSNSAVLDEDPAAHIEAIINGLAGKVIDGVSYAAPMPPFGSVLSDEQIAAVVNHERSQWGNQGKLISAADVEAAR